MRLLPRFFRSTAWICLALATRTRADIPVPEKILPADTLAAVSAPDFTRLRTLYQASPQWQLWNDPDMAAFKNKFVARWKEQLLLPLERDIGINLSDYEDLPQGQLTIAMIQNGWPASEAQPGFLLLLDAKSKSDRLKNDLALLRRKWVEGGKPIKTAKIRDLEFLTLPVSEKDIPASLRKLYSPAGSENETPTNNASVSQLLLGQFESMLIVGTSEKTVEKAVAHLTGGAAPALAGVAAFEADRLALFHDVPFWGWVNVKALVGLLAGPVGEKDPAQSPLAMFSPQKIAGVTGLSGLKTLAWAGQSSAEGLLVKFFLGIPEPARDGLFKLFPAGIKESSPPSFVPLDAVKFQRWRIDGQGAWAAMQKMLSALSPQFTGSLNFILETATEAARQKDPDFDIKKNLFGNLGDDVINYEKAPRGATPAELSAAPSLWLLGSPKAEQLAAALKYLFLIASQAGGTPAEREFLGHKIYSVPVVPLPFGLSGPTPSPGGSLSYAACGGYVALSTDPALIEEYIRSSNTPPKPLRESAGLGDAAARAGGLSTGWFGFENQAATSRAAFESLRGAGTNAPALNNPLLPAGVRDWADFSLLPPFDKIARYFHFTVLTGNASAEGLMFQFFSPAPPLLKK